MRVRYEETEWFEEGAHVVCSKAWDRLHRCRVWHYEAKVSAPLVLKYWSSWNALAHPYLESIIDIDHRAGIAISPFFMAFGGLRNRELGGDDLSRLTEEKRSTEALLKKNDLWLLGLAARHSFLPVTPRHTQSLLRLPLSLDEPHD